MGLSLWMTIIRICCVFCHVTTDTGYTSVVSNSQGFQGTTEQTPQNNTSNQLSWASNKYIIIFVPIALVLLAAIIITVLVIICRRKGEGDLQRQQSIYYGNSEVPCTVEHNGYQSTEKEKDNYEPKPRLTAQEEPIYINVQGQCSVESGVESNQSDNIYCNVGYETYH